MDYSEGSKMPIFSAYVSNITRLSRGPKDHIVSVRLILGCITIALP
jgi:hypothetical protein